ncbi:hypothetical protein GN958_ATG13787 [Phytophthora infestans]|uniref:Transmembrane protein n=1 Tax=Phytophthora infestans TaxID=4787 RepID=A0A8S9U7X2_PHYIN|nr:hypothetical protein GN958_ATG13787 [Phytophthora infestans]
MATSQRWHRPLWQVEQRQRNGAGKDKSNDNGKGNENGNADGNIVTLASSASGESSPGKSNNGNNGKGNGNGNGAGKDKSSGNGKGNKNGNADGNIVTLASSASGESSPGKSNNGNGNGKGNGKGKENSSGNGESASKERPIGIVEAGSTTSQNSRRVPGAIGAQDTITNEEHDKRASKIKALSIQSLDAAAEEGKQYVRGDPMLAGIDGGGGSSIFAEGGDGSSPLVIGGKKRGWQAEAQSGLFAASSGFHNTLRFSVCSATIVSVGLLLAFHFEVLNKGLARHFPSGSVWTPNTWEFAMYVQYIQQIAAISALTLLKTPFFLWEFTDLFSWANLLVYRSEDNSSASGRRLTTIILGSLVGYGDRIGTSEMDLMFETISGFALIVGFFVGVLLGATLYNKWREHIGEKARRGVIWRCLGLLPLVWFFSLLPLTMTVSFEVSMEFKSSMLELWSLVVAFLVIILVICGVAGVVARTVRSATYGDFAHVLSGAHSTPTTDTVAVSSSCW